MAYEHITYEMLLARMLDRISGALDKREGSLLYNSNAPAAVELQELYIQLDNILNETFVDTCTREPLLKRMSERGLYPNPATPATLKCVVTPSTIPVENVIGARFNIDNLNYIVIEDREGLADGEFKIRCETAGKLGEYPIGILTVIDTEIAGMTKAEIPENAVLVHGSDEEDTESCRQKYMDSLNTTAFGGNKADYRVKIKDSAVMGVSVGAVKVFPNTNANGESGHGGHVQIAILDSNLDVASADLITAVQNKIDPEGNGNGDGIAPIGHIVHITTAGEEPVYIKLTGSLVDGITFEDMQADVETQIKTYLYTVKGQWEDSGNLILSSYELYKYITMVAGFEFLEVKFTDVAGSAEYDSISVAGGNIPVFGSVKFTAGE